MNILDAIILGIIEGITEFLPVSSSAHLFLASLLLGIPKALQGISAVGIQLGAVLAILIYFRKEFIALIPLSIFKEANNNKGFAGWRGIVLLMLGTLPAILCGLLIKPILNTLFNELSIAVFLVVGALYIIVIEYYIRRRHACYSSLSELTPKLAIIIGCFQCLALFPGFSRSTATIMGALLLGVNRGTAVQFSFMLSVPVIAGACFLEIFSNTTLFLESFPMLSIAGGTSFFISLLAMYVCIPLLQRISYIPFAVYRIIVGVIVFALLYK